jgi:hypothetical protein
VIGECSWCGGPLLSQFAVTVFGPWLRTLNQYEAYVEWGVPREALPVWCSVICREASGSPALGALMYPEAFP